MKAFFVTLLFIFITFFGMCGHTSALSLCDEVLDEDWKIINIFNLHDDLIIQMQQETTSNVTFWRVSDTDMRPVLDKYFDPKDADNPKNIAKGVRYKINMSKDLFDDIENLNFNGITIDPTKPVTAQTPKLRHIRDIQRSCFPDTSNSSTPQTPNQTCQAYMSLVYSDQHLVCVYNAFDISTGSNDNIKGVPALYTSPHSPRRLFATRRLTNIEKVLVPFFSEICKLWPATWAVWNSIAEPVFADFLHLGGSKDLNKTSLLLNIVDETQQNQNLWEAVGITLPLKKDFFLFRFNSYYKMMTCPYDCGLDTPLSLLSIKLKHQRKDSEPMVVHNETELTIRRMIGCEVKADPFDPNSFCHADRKFISIMNLGNDLYFQEVGRFWRYSHHGFNVTVKVFDPEGRSNVHRVMPVRLESEMAALLEKQNLDTSYPLTAVTFDAGYHDSCYWANKECNTRLSKTNEYFSVCLYGKSNLFSGGLEKPRKGGYGLYGWSGLYYTPSGVKVNENRHVKDRIDLICERLYENLKFDQPTQIRSMTTAHRYDGEVKYVKLWCIFRDNDDYNHVLRVMEFQSYPEIGGYKVLGSHDLEPRGNGEHLGFIEKNRMIERLITIFRYQDKIMVYNISAQSRKNLHEYHLSKDNIIGSTEIFHLDMYPISKLLHCPFNSTTVFVPIKEEYICERKNMNLVTSIFTIGNHAYHQLGKLFFKYTEDTFPSFRADKYVTNLINDYFDANHRITGYSIPRGSRGEAAQHFEVLIHGRSNLMHRNLGEYIYAVFMFGEDDILPLSARQSHLYEFLKAEFTIGTGASHNDFVEAFGTAKDPENRTILIWINLDGNEVQKFASINPGWYNFMFKTKTQLDEISPDKGWKVIVNEAVTEYFKYPVGIHGALAQNQKNFIREDVLVMFARKEPALPIGLKTISRPVKANEEFQQSLFPYPYYTLKTCAGCKHELNVFYEELFCSVELKSDSKFDIKTVKLIFASVLLILLSVVSVIAFYKYHKNEQKFKSIAKFQNTSKN